MTAPDFAAILESDTMWGHSASDVLAAKRPDLCQTCDGSGKVTESFGPMTRGYRIYDCPDCPTIAKLLAIGAAVLRLESREPDYVALPSGESWYSRALSDFVTEMRAVQP